MSAVVPRSWYFVAPSRAVIIRRPHTSLLADGQLTLAREPSGDLVADHSGVALPVMERSGLILVWLGGGEPAFDVPAFAAAGWSPMTFDCIDLAVAPRVVLQGQVELGHLESLHRFSSVRTGEALTVKGAALSTHVSFGWDTRIVGLSIPLGFRSDASGLGLQKTEVGVPGGRAFSRHLVMPTPYAGGKTRVHLGVSVRLGQGMARFERLARWCIHRFTALAFRRHVARNAAMWWGGDRAYHPPPAAQLEAFSAWADQFETGFRPPLDPIAWNFASHDAGADAST